jgi:biopolymer transport protein ExbD
MSKVKLPRKSTAIDMTAMCDVAFLLLSFFILTTKFKPNEVAQINIPASTAQLPLPDKDILLIQVEKGGKVFIGVDDQNTRALWLAKMAEHYKFKVTATMQHNFVVLDSYGVTASQLPQFLALSPEELNKVKQQGISMEVKPPQPSEFMDAILFARQSNPKLRIAVKADKEASYEDVNEVIAQLQERKVNKFNLITSGRAANVESANKE